jgi:glycerol uptake facilitator protein
MWGIGLSLAGTTTGDAINPARDFGPRLVHTLLTSAGKDSSHWGYAGIPIIEPSVDACLAGLVARQFAL